jgi:hypothetical protein
MFIYERHKNPFKPGGVTVHHYPMLELSLIWTTDWEFKYLPPIWDPMIVFALANVLFFAF